MTRKRDLAKLAKSMIVPLSSFKKSKEANIFFIFYRNTKKAALTAWFSLAVLSRHTIALKLVLLGWGHSRRGISVRLPLPLTRSCIARRARTIENKEAVENISTFCQGSAWTLTTAEAAVLRSTCVCSVHWRSLKRLNWQTLNTLETSSIGRCQTLARVG